MQALINLDLKNIELLNRHFRVLLKTSGEFCVPQQCVI